MLKVEIQGDQFNKLAYNSVNYACGRSSYIIGIVIRIVRDNIEFVNFPMATEIARLIINRDYGCTDMLNSSHVDDWRLLARDLLDTNNNEALETVEITFEDDDDLRLLILTSFRSNLYFPDSEIVPDYSKILNDCVRYMDKNWYQVFLTDINEAVYYGVDLAPYRDTLSMVYEAERSRV